MMPYKNAEEKNANQRKNAKVRRAQKIKDGECIRCPNPARSGRTLCAVCAAHASRVVVDQRFQPKGIATRNMIIARYRHAAKKRGLVWGLTTEQFITVVQQDCHYCGEPPIERDYVYHSSKRQKNQRYNGGWACNGIDRKDNIVGYVLENCLPCCKMCNFAKRDTGYDEFMSYLNRVARFQMGVNQCQ